MITIDLARTLYEAAGDSTHDFDHVQRVYHLAERIGQAENADMVVLLWSSFSIEWPPK